MDIQFLFALMETKRTTCSPQNPPPAGHCLSLFSEHLHNNMPPHYGDTLRMSQMLLETTPHETDPSTSTCNTPNLQPFFSGTWHWKSKCHSMWQCRSIYGARWGNESCLSVRRRCRRQHKVRWKQLSSIYLWFYNGRHLWTEGQRLKSRGW